IHDALQNRADADKHRSAWSGRSPEHKAHTLGSRRPQGLSLRLLLAEILPKFPFNGTYVIPVLNLHVCNAAKVSRDSCVVLPNYQCLALALGSRKKPCLVDYVVPRRGVENVSGFNFVVRHEQKNTARAMSRRLFNVLNDHSTGPKIMPV